MWGECNGPGQGMSTASKTTDGPCVSPSGDHTTRKYNYGDQPNDGETTWTNTVGTRSGRGQRHAEGIGRGILMPTPNHGTQRLPNDDDGDDDDDDDDNTSGESGSSMKRREEGREGTYLFDTTTMYNTYL